MADLQLQPRYLTIQHRDNILIVDRDGWIGEGRSGLFSRDTRYLSAYRLTFNGIDPRFLGLSQPYHFAHTFYYTNSRLGSRPHEIPENSLLLKVTRYIGDALHEEIELSNFAGRLVELSLVLNIGADFADIFQVRGLVPIIPRIARVRWDAARKALNIRYRKKEFERTLCWQLEEFATPPLHAVRTVTFPIQLEQGQTWRSSAITLLGDEEESNQPAVDSFDEMVADLGAWQQATASIATPVEAVKRTYEQAVLDLAALRLEDVAGGWFLSAGVPWYAAVFGRDSLVTALQMITANSSIAVAVLNRLTRLQASTSDASRDQEPGRLPHELRRDELTHFGKLPYSPYYGGIDAPLLYVILLHELYRFTGDADILLRFLPAAEACLEWAARYGDFDGDGFVEYRPLAPSGYRHQGWKDSADAVVYPDGSPVDPPIAIVEVQGYYYDALRRLAAMLRALGRQSDAAAYDGRAVELAARVNDAFWLDEEGTYAFGLDPAKRAIRSLASNAGHLLWSRLAPAGRARRLVARLLDPEMFSGWGVRTLTSRNPSFDPVSYQRGSVWPHDNAIIALGCKHYGLWQEANRIAGAIFDVAACYQRHSLPEVFAGMDRSSGAAPVPYAEANLPQAWAAGSIAMLLRAMIGLEPVPERRLLLVSPTLPEWLPELTLRNLRVMGCRLDLKLTGVGSGTRLELIRLEGHLELKHLQAGAILDLQEM